MIKSNVIHLSYRPSPEKLEAFAPVPTDAVYQVATPKAIATPLKAKPKNLPDNWKLIK